MPTLSFFYGIKIQIYWSDHPPPHFHAECGESRAVFDIETLEMIGGGLPPAKAALVLEWAEEHRTELMEAWDLCSRQIPPNKILPLP
jgi:hypothetical protein